MLMDMVMTWEGYESGPMGHAGRERPSVEVASTHKLHFRATPTRKGT